MVSIDWDAVLQTPSWHLKQRCDLFLEERGAADPPPRPAARVGQGGTDHQAELDYRVAWALKRLGFPKEVAERASVAAAVECGPGAGLEVLVRTALRTARPKRGG